MSKKTIVFYTTEQVDSLKSLFAQPESKERRQKITEYATSIGRSYTSVYAKANASGMIPGAGPKAHKAKGHKASQYKSPVVDVKKENARTNGTEVRFKFSNFRVDMATSEVVFTIGK